MPEFIFSKYTGLFLDELKLENKLAIIFFYFKMAALNLSITFGSFLSHGRKVRPSPGTLGTARVPSGPTGPSRPLLTSGTPRISLGPLVLLGM